MESWARAAGSTREICLSASVDWSTHEIFASRVRHRTAAKSNRVQSGVERCVCSGDAVRQRFAREIQSGNVIVHRLAAAEAAAEFADEYFDWIYIDGNHQYEFVLLDLESYYPKVKAGGFLVGDDYGVEGWWHGGVTRAVRWWFEDIPAYM
jgi:cephalosporin hydroxylase